MALAPQTPLLCPQCDFPFKDKRGVSAHYRYKHPGVPLPWKDTSSDASRAEVHEERMSASEAAINNELAAEHDELPKAEGGLPPDPEVPPHNPFNLQTPNLVAKRVALWRARRSQ